MGYGSPYESDFEHNHGSVYSHTSWENPTKPFDFDTDHSLSKKTIIIIVICVIKVILITLGLIYLCKKCCRCCKKNSSEKLKDDIEEEGIYYYLY